AYAADVCGRGGESAGDGLYREGGGAGSRGREDETSQGDAERHTLHQQQRGRAGGPGSRGRPAHGRAPSSVSQARTGSTGIPRRSQSTPGSPSEAISASAMSSGPSGDGSAARPRTPTARSAATAAAASSAAAPHRSPIKSTHERARPSASESRARSSGSSSVRTRTAYESQ